MLKIPTPKELLYNRGFRYLLSGMLSFLVENVSFNVFYYLFSLSPKVSNIGSVFIALIVNFFVSKYFVFRNKSEGRDAAKQLFTYIVIVLVNLTISTLSVEKLIKRGLPGFEAKLFMTVVIVSWTFILYKKLVFKTTNKQ